MAKETKQPNVTIKNKKASFEAFSLFRIDLLGPLSQAC